MTAIWVSTAAALAAFVAGLFGLCLQRLLPEPHTSDRSRDMITAIVGLVSLLLALVLGTITGSAYAFYSNQKTELETIAARALQLDIALAEFGPEAKEARADLKAGTQRVHDMFWGERPIFDSDPAQVAPGSIESLKATDAAIAALDPRTPLQKQAAAAAVVDAGLIQNTRLLIALQSKSPVSWPLVTVVVLWSILLFCGFGRNRRALGGYVGLGGTPFSSGGSEREQGIGKDGNRRVRAAMVELAWTWLRWQSDSALSVWFRACVGAMGGRIKKIMIVALARKLLVALWRYVKDGVIPDGARMKAA